MTYAIARLDEIDALPDGSYRYRPDAYQPNDPKNCPEKPLPRARLHDLRHVHATMLPVAGVPVHVVAERLGHADPAITLRGYAHVIRREAVGIADVFTAAVEQDAARETVRTVIPRWLQRARVSRSVSKLDLM